MRWIRLFAFAIFSILLVFGSYYFICVSNREDIVSEYFLRVLSTAGRSFEDSLRTLWLNVGTMANDKSFSSDDATRYFEDLEQKCRLVKALEPEGHMESIAPFQRVGDGAPVRLAGHRLWAVVDRVDGKGALRFLVGPAKGAGPSDQGSASTPPQGWIATAFLGPLIDASLPEVGFDKVVLVRQGVVLAETGKSHLRLTTLPWISKGGATGPEERNGEVGGSQITDVEVAGTRYKLFRQPVRVPIAVGQRLTNGDVAKDVSHEPWIVAGLLRSSSLRQQVLTIAPSFVLAIIGLILVGLLCLPYLKLRYIGVREGLRTADVMALLVCTVALSSLLTFALVYATASDRLGRDRDAHLEELAREILGSFRNEVGEMNETLEALDGQLRVAEQSDAKAEGDLLLRHRVEPYPFLEMAYRMNDGGIQTSKLTVKSESTPLINVSTRRYFRDARDGRVWTDGYSLESIRSRTTGVVSAVLCRRMNEDPLDSHVYGAILAPLLSLIDPVVPMAFGFAVINGDGEVLFHSDSDRNLKENFYEEIDAEDEVRAAVRAPSRLVDATYRARSLRLFVSPLKPSPWTLIVFADKQDEWSAQTEILAFALLLLGGHLLLLLACLSLLHWSKAARKPHGIAFFVWYWPGKTWWTRYVRILIGLLLVVVCWILLMMMDAPRPETAVLGSLFAAAAVAFVHLTLRSTASPQWIPSIGKKANARETLRSIMPYCFAAAVGISIAFLRGETMVGGAALILAGLVVWRCLTSTCLAIFTAVIVVAFHLGANAGLELSFVTGLLVLLPVIAFCPFPKLDSWIWFRARWRKVYSTGAILLLFIVGVFPAASFFFFAYDDGSFLVQKCRQMKFAEDLQRRQARITTRYKGTELGENNETIRKRLRLGPASTDKHLPYDVYSAGLISVQDTSRSGGENGRSRVHAFLSSFRILLPTFSRTTPILRALETGPSDEIGVQWNRSTGDDSIRMTFELPGVLSSPKSDGIMLRSPTAALGEWVYLFVIGPLALLGIFWIFVGSVVFRLFLIHMRHPLIPEGQKSPAGPDRKGQIFVRADRELVQEVMAAKETYPIDARLLRSTTPVSEIVSGAEESACTVVAVDRFDNGLEETAIAERKIELLEGLLGLEQKRTYLFCDIEPLYFLTRLSDDHQRGYRSGAPDLERWAGLLERFIKRRRGLHRPDAEKEEQDFLTELEAVRTSEGQGAVNDDERKALRLIARECWPTLQLRDLGRRLALNPELGIFSRPWRVVAQVKDLADSYYRRLWTQSNVDERMILLTIAEDGFVNWQTRDTLGHLLTRGLVLATPNFRLMNESFRRFVVAAEPREVFERWEAEAGESVWSRLKAPVAICVVVAAAFFFVTQREVLDQTLAFVAALAAGAPALMNIFSVRRRVSSDPEKQPPAK